MKQWLTCSDYKKDEDINPKTSVLKNKVNFFDHLIYYKILDLDYKPNMSNICIKSWGLNKIVKTQCIELL